MSLSSASLSLSLTSVSAQLGWANTHARASEREQELELAGKLQSTVIRIIGGGHSDNWRIPALKKARLCSTSRYPLIKSKFNQIRYITMHTSCLSQMTDYEIPCPALYYFKAYLCTLIDEYYCGLKKCSTTKYPVLHFYSNCTLIQIHTLRRRFI